MQNIPKLLAWMMSLLLFLTLTPAANAQALKGKIAENADTRDNSVYPTDLQYAKTHEYVRVINERYAVIGLTHFFTNQLGGVTSVQLPKPGQVLKKDDRYAVVESAMCIADVFMPVSGKVVAVNTITEEKPGLVHNNCYNSGWLVTVELIKPEELQELLSSLQYRCFIAQ